MLPFLLTIILWGCKAFNQLSFINNDNCWNGTIVVQWLIQDLFGVWWYSYVATVFCWAWPVNPFSWITWCSLTRSRSSWWLKRSDLCTSRPPLPLPSRRCWWPPRPRTAGSMACRCPSPSRCPGTTLRALPSLTSPCTPAQPPALCQVQCLLPTHRMGSHRSHCLTLVRCRAWVRAYAIQLMHACQ